MSVPFQWPGAGWTTRPLGLSTARKLSSSYSTLSGRSSGTTVSSAAARSRTVTVWPRSSFVDFLATGAPSTRTLELLEIETPVSERRRGHATKLIAGLRETLPLVVDGVPLLWAKDASDVAGLYEAWGFEARDDEYPHVWALSLAEG